MQREERGGRDRGLSRRDLLKRAGVAGVAATVPAGVLAPEASPAVDDQGLRALTTKEAQTLEAVLERLIPTDDLGPGAKEANVLRYIDRSLAGDLQSFRDAYASGLAGIDSLAQGLFGADYASLTTAQQEAILHALETGKPGVQVPEESLGKGLSAFTPTPRSVFEMIRTHALQGMFGDPIHGGNTNMVGWDLVNFPRLKFTYTAHDQQLDVEQSKTKMSLKDITLFTVKGHYRGK